MASSIFEFKSARLLENLPVLSLKNTVLLPGTKISLRLVEPKHIGLVFASLKNDRLIAVIQPKRGKELFDVGCMGRIISFAETPQNHLLIGIAGICRFKVKRVMDEVDYHTAEVDYSPYINDLNEQKAPCFSRKDFIAVLTKYIQVRNINFDVTSLEVLADDRLLQTVIMMLPFEAREKQAFLEARTAEEAFKTLTLLLKTETIALL